MNLTLEQAQEIMRLNGGSLDLRGCTGLTVLPEGLIVGGSLDLDGTGISNPKVKHLHNGDYVEGRYLYADGILTHVKRRIQVGNYTYFEGKIPCRNVLFDGTNYAHCDSREQGFADLRFKAAKDRGAEQYRGLPLDAEFSLDEMVTMYRVITGACQQGSESFVDNLGAERKDRYTIQEAIELTKDQYGETRFAAFFSDAG